MVKRDFEVNLNEYSASQVKYNFPGCPPIVAPANLDSGSTRAIMYIVCSVYWEGRGEGREVFSTSGDTMSALAIFITLGTESYHDASGRIS